MDSNQSGFTHFPRIPTNRVDNNQPSINDLTYTYRSLTQTMRDVMIGYNTNINTYNQNITSFLSTINDYRHDIRTTHTHVLNESRNLSPTATAPPSTPIRPVRSRNTNMRRNQPTETQTGLGTTQSMTFSFSRIIIFKYLYVPYKYWSASLRRCDSFTNTTRNRQCGRGICLY